MNEMYNKIIKSSIAQELAIKGLWIYSKAMVYIEKGGKYCYDNNDTIHSIVDHYNWIIEQTDILFFKCTSGTNL